MKMRIDVLHQFLESEQRFGMMVGFFFGPGLIMGVEVGVHQARHTLKMLHSAPELRLIGVDMWELHADMDSPYLRSPGSLPAKFADRQQALAWHQEAESLTEPFRNRCELFCEPSEVCAKRWKDGAFDFVYLDGDHSTEGLLNDLRKWYPKVKAGGLIAGHDWGQFGVNDALDEFFHSPVFHNAADAKTGKCWLMEKMA